MESPQAPGLFRLGQIAITPAARQLCQQFAVSPFALIARHSRGDWGELDAHDLEVNRQALESGARLLSSYSIDGKTIWVITEADRSVTTVLLPADY